MTEKEGLEVAVHLPAVILDCPGTHQGIAIMVGYHDGDAIKLHWTTEKEVRSAGLPLYRGTRCCLTQEMKVAQNGTLPEEAYRHILDHARKRMGMFFEGDRFYGED